MHNQNIVGRALLIGAGKFGVVKFGLQRTFLRQGGRIGKNVGADRMFFADFCAYPILNNKVKSG